MPYPNDEFEQSPCIACPSCGHKIALPPVDLEDRCICDNCNHVILIKIVDEGDRSFNTPDPRHIC